jgi:hypothetical protein
MHLHTHTHTHIHTHTPTTTIFPPSPAWINAIDRANKDHAHTSSNAAAPSAVAPTVVVKILVSFKIRANTGKAVMEIATHTKTAKLFSFTFSNPGSVAMRRVYLWMEACVCNREREREDG